MAAAASDFTISVGGCGRGRRKEQKQEEGTETMVHADGKYKTELSLPERSHGVNPLQEEYLSADTIDFNICRSVSGNKELLYSSADGQWQNQETSGCGAPKLWRRCGHFLSIRFV